MENITPHLECEDGRPRLRKIKRKEVRRVQGRDALTKAAQHTASAAKIEN